MHILLTRMMSSLTPHSKCQPGNEWLGGEYKDFLEGVISCMYQMIYLLGGVKRRRRRRRRKKKKKKKKKKRRRRRFFFT